jgi:hypothetical protein
MIRDAATIVPGTMRRLGRQGGTSDCRALRTPRAIPRPARAAARTAARERRQCQLPPSRCPERDPGPHRSDLRSLWRTPTVSGRRPPVPSGTSATEAVAAEKRMIAGSATGRIPYRSTSRPTTGVAMPVMHSPTTIAEETVPRAQPNSCATGGSSTPNVNCMIGPLPTSKPITDAKTIHQRLRSAVIEFRLTSALGWKPSARWSASQALAPRSRSTDADASARQRERVQ